MNVQCSSSASFAGAIARGRDREEDEEEERKRRILRKKGRRVSLAHGRRPTCTTSKRAKWGGKGIKKKELGKDFKLVYNDVEMRTIID